MIQRVNKSLRHGQPNTMNAHRKLTGNQNRVQDAVRAGIVLALSLLAVTCYSVSDGRKEQQSSDRTSLATAGAPITSAELRHAATQGKVTAPSIETRQLRSALDLARTLGVPPSRFEVINNPSTWITKAKQGDARAALAVYETLTSCLNFSDASTNGIDDPARRSIMLSTDCRTIPKDLSRDKLALLQPAADTGNPLARLVYAMEAIKLSRISSTTGTPSISSATSEKARTYLEDAATYGIKEAYIQLFVASDRGTFGQPDTTPAAAYLMAARQLDGSITLPIDLDAYLARLRPGDRLRAEELGRQIAARCCRQP